MVVSKSKSKRAPNSKDCSCGASAKRGKNQGSPQQKKDGVFSWISALFVARGVSNARLQIWKNRFESLGGTVIDPQKPLPELTYVMAADEKALEELDVLQPQKLKNLSFLAYEWLQSCLTEGCLVPTERYQLRNPFEPGATFDQQASTAALENVQVESVSAGASTSTHLQQQLSVVVSTEIFDSNNSQSTLGIGFADSEEQGPTRISRLEAVETVTTVTETDAAALSPEREEDFASSDEERDLNFRDKLRRKQTFYGKQEEPDLNEHLTNPLAEMWHLYEDVLGDQWRAVSYRKAVNKLRGLPFKVTNAEQIKNTYGLGASLVQKIKEILGTGQLQKLEHLKAQVGEIQILGSVWGIGAVQARLLYKKGYRTVKDLAAEESLSVMARMGVKYHDDISLRIPREEVAEAESFVRDIVESFAPGAWVNAAGSYRRGKLTCGDIDILITHPDGSSHHDLLARLVQQLRRIQFVVDGLHVDENARKGGTQPDMFMGICRFQNRLHRRIDIKVYPRHVYAFALLAFTGNDVLNRKIRFLARVKFGYKLSDQGLFVRESKKKDAKASTESIPCETEQEVFEKLGLSYPEPHERNW